MTKITKKIDNKARLFVAGMGTVLTVVPVTHISCVTASSSERVANATTRVGTYFSSVLHKQEQRKREQNGQEARS